MIENVAARSTFMPNPTKLESLRQSFSDGEPVVHITGYLKQEVYDYFFKHVIAYNRGVKVALISFFFQRLYEEFQAREIPAVWDEENNERVLQILNQLNFNEPNTHTCACYEPVGIGTCVDIGTIGN